MDVLGRVRGRQPVTLVGVLGGAAAICACSLIVGQAVWRIAGFQGWSLLAGPVGLATLLCVARATASLPGGRVTAGGGLGPVMLAGLAPRPRGGAGGGGTPTGVPLVPSVAGPPPPLA